MEETLFVLNAGSSSLKFSVFRDREPPEVLLRGQLEALATRPRFVARDGAGKVVAEKEWPAGEGIDHDGAIEFLLEWARGGAIGKNRVRAVGHRVVHGGARFQAPVRIDAKVLEELDRLVPLAPLHQPHGLAAIRAVERLAPDLPQIACFDTAFHRTQPELAQTFALPRRYTEAGVLRYGFHGLSYEYVASILPRIDADAASGRTIVAHLGNGCSMCAMKGGRSLATTMGFTPVDGLMMGTRSGAVDPGVLIFLMDRFAMDARAIEHLLNEESGLLGVSGISSDMRTLLASKDSRAAEAVDLFIYRCGRELGSLAAALGGLDALVFTGGIGENAASIRARVCRDAAWLGLALDDAANDAGGPRVSAAGSTVSAWVVPTNEELMIALHTQRVLAGKR
jgi:acetate kinase